MSNLREIKKRISSVSSTKQITRTMEMVATAKIRRALDRAASAEPYKKAITDVMLTVAQSGGSAESNPLFQLHDKVERALIVVVTSDRGLAGGFNINCMRECERMICKYAAEGIESEVITCGRKASEYFRSRDVHIALSFIGESAEPTLESARVISDYIKSSYESGHIDKVHVIYHHARNRVDQELRVEQLLPLDYTALAAARGPRTQEGNGPKKIAASFSFIPSAEHVLEHLVPSYILTVIQQALIDSAAAEQGARRKAMHSATENATSIIGTLQRTYNRVRQASITTELNEIVGGAAALEEM